MKKLLIFLIMCFIPTTLYGFDDDYESNREILIDIRDNLEAIRYNTGDSTHERMMRAIRILEMHQKEKEQLEQERERRPPAQKQYDFDDLFEENSK